jgi:hypothetical protein
MLDRVDYRKVAADWRTEHLQYEFEDKSKVCRQYRSILDNLVDQATKHARDSALTEDELKSDVLAPTGEFVREFACSFFLREELQSRHSFWTHRSSPMQGIVSKKTPKMDRDSLQESVGMYLALPVRHQQVDRCLIDALVALELFAFGDEMLNEPRFPGIPTRSPLRRSSHPLWAFIKGQFGNVVGACLLFLFALVPYKLGWIGEVGLAVVALILFGLVCLAFFIGLVGLPSFWRQQHKATTRVTELLRTMVTVYAELNSNGLISVRHFRERVARAADEGVIWPSTLFVLLDDVEARVSSF